MDLHMKETSVLLALKVFKILSDFGVPKSFSLLFSMIKFVSAFFNRREIFINAFSFDLNPSGCSGKYNLGFEWIFSTKNYI